MPYPGTSSGACRRAFSAISPSRSRSRSSCRRWTWRSRSPAKKRSRAIEPRMKIRDEIDGLAAALGKMAAELKAHQDKLSSFGQGLESMMTELHRRNQEITLFSKMNDFLQTSTTEAEAYSVISDTVTRLFPEDSGAVFVLNASRDMLEAAAVWGPQP